MSVTWHTGFSQWQPLFVDSRRQIAQSQNRSRMCEIRLTKVGIVHFYAVTEIKGLSCRLWWMREWRNLLTSRHVGYRSVIRAVASGASLKFGVQGASATNWFSRVNGAQDNGIRLYAPCQWEMTLYCNVISHWLGAYTKWSLMHTCVLEVMVWLKVIIQNFVQIWVNIASGNSLVPDGTKP